MDKINKIDGLEGIILLTSILSMPQLLNAMEVEGGFKYKKGQYRPLVTVSETYKEGKLILKDKIEKVLGSPLALKLTEILPIGKAYFGVLEEKVGVNPSFEPLYYIISGGLGRKIGNLNTTLNLARAKSNSKGTSYSSSVMCNYKLNKKTKLKGLMIVPIKNPKEPIFKFKVSYRL